MKIILFTLIPLILSIGIAPIFAEHMGSHHDDDSMDQHGMKDDMMGQHHMSYMGMCAPGFASLGEMCVLDDRCGPGAYAGKVCIMDGKMKQYLKPLHQKYAGISVDNIICAEGKQVMFKHHNAAPACINSDSVEKLKHRGWQTELPNLPCTLEYMPVCGVDGISYGNICALNANHMVMKHDGQCMETPSVKTMILYIDSKLVDCVGVAPQQCMLVKEDLNSEWEMFYGSIEGFEYQEGTEYKISVTITDIENPPADASSLKYILEQILDPGTDSCGLEPDAGLCKAYMPRYYFDETTNSCQEFIWGGCNGVVPFETMESCTQQCKVNS